MDRWPVTHTQTHTHTHTIILQTEIVIQFRQSNKEQHKILNKVENFLEHFCSGSGQHQLYTASTNTYKRKKNM